MPKANDALAKKRTLIDEVDHQIVLMLKKRFKLIRDIQKIKDKRKLPLYNKKREAQILMQAQRLLAKTHNKREILNILKMILDESLKYLKKRAEPNPKLLLKNK